MKTPTFFISSTIFDFKDLRSSLKYYLEQQGYKVLASEYNDFQKPLDKHSYDACIQALQQADYFVLLIGSRVGGWFDEKAKVSITQQEYREAYKLHLAGKLKIISFVRSEIWSLREDRKELSRYIDRLNIEDGLALDIKNRPSRSMHDAEFIDDFISEVGRTGETKRALAEGGEFPTANWIHTFSGFGEIISAIDAQVLSGTPIEHAITLHLVRNELIEVMRKSLLKINSKAFCPVEWVHNFHSRYGGVISTTFDSSHTTVITVGIMRKFSLLCMHFGSIRHATPMIDRALESPVFLEFNNSSTSFEESQIYKTLYGLREELRLFGLANISDYRLPIMKAVRGVAKYGESDEMHVNSVNLWALLHLLDRWVNIVSYCQSLIPYFFGKEFREPCLRPISPIAAQSEALEEERTNVDDVLTWLGIEQ